jgi:RNA exonuclease 1
LTEDGSELTRVSVVDSTGKRIYDSLVKPDKPILDYLTRCVVLVCFSGSSLPAINLLLVFYSYSGLNAETLAPVTTKLVDIQEALTALIDYNTILIGHSLECDLRVIKVSLQNLRISSPSSPSCP